MRLINFLSPILLILLPLGAFGDGEDPILNDYVDDDLDTCVQKARPKLDKCDQDFEKMRQDKTIAPQEICSHMLHNIHCHVDIITTECSNETVNPYFRMEFRPEINASWCPLCEGAYKAMESHGGHLYHDDADKKMPTYCNYHDYANVSCLRSDQGEPRHFLSLCEAQFVNAMAKNKGEKEHFCSTLYFRIRCIFNEVWNYCDGKDKSSEEAMTALEYLRTLSREKFFQVPNITYCGYCEKVIKFLEETVKVHLLVEGGMYGSYCDIFGSYMEKPATTTTPAGALSSSTEDPIKPTAAGLCFKRASVKRDFEQCTGVQQTFMDPSKTCSHKLLTAECVYNKINESCGEKDANEFMKLLYVSVMADDCPYCSAVVKYMEGMGGHVFKLFGKEKYCTLEGTPEPSPSPAKHLCPGISTTPRCDGPQQFSVEGVCDGIMGFLDCMYNEVRIGCDEETANDTVKEMPVAVSDQSYCRFCNAAAMFLNKFGNVMNFYKDKDDSKSGACAAPEPESCVDEKAIMEQCATMKNDTNPTEFCMATLTELQCELEEVMLYCGQDITINHMRKKRVTVKPQFCDSCAQVVKFLETFETHLYIEGEKHRYCQYPTPAISSTSMVTTVGSTEKPSPQQCVEGLVNSGELSKKCAKATSLPMEPYEADCSNLFTFMTCIHGLISENCDKDIAGQYLRKASFFVRNSSYCPYCTKATEFVGKFGGFVYDSVDQITPCVPAVPSCAEREEMINAISICRTSHKITSKTNPKDACDAMHKIAKCINGRAHVLCAEDEAKEFMKRPILYIFPKLCAHCQEVARYLERKEGHLYINVGLTRVCHVRETDPTTTPGSSISTLDSSTASPYSSTDSTDSSTAISSTSSPDPGLPESLCPGVEFPPEECDKFQRIAENKTDTCSILMDMAYCIYGAIMDKCGHNITMEYLKYVQFGVPDVSYCLTCKDAVKFLRHMNIHLYDDRFDTNLTDAEGNCDTSLIPPTPEIPEPDNCADKTAMRLVNSHCTWLAVGLHSIMPAGGVCKAMDAAAKCIYKGATKVCGKENATIYMATPVLSVDSRYCSDKECSDVIDFLGNFGGHLYTYGNNITMCEKGMEPPKPGPCKEIDTQIKNMECAQMQIMPDTKDDTCDSLYKLVQCVYDKAVNACGNETAERHIEHAIYGIPNPSYCPACENVVRYLKKLGSHLYDYSTPDGKCSEDLTTTVATPNVPLITSDTTAETEPSKPVTTSTKPVTTTAPVTTPAPSFDVCKKKIEEKDTSDALANCKKTYDERMKATQDTRIAFEQPCAHVLKYISCMHDALYPVCGETNTHKYLVEVLEIAVDPEWCPYCKNAMDYTDGLKLYIRDSKNGHTKEHHCKQKECCMNCRIDGVFEKCREKGKQPNPQEECKELLMAAQCTHKTVKDLCLEDKANSYMKKTDSVRVSKSECPFCKDVVDYMESFGGHVYFEDGKTMCDAKNETQTTKSQPTKAPVINTMTAPETKPHVHPTVPPHVTLVPSSKLDNSGNGAVLFHSVPVIYILWIFFTFFA